MLVRGALAALMMVAADERFEPHFRDFEGIWNFAAPEETEARLRSAGFDPAKCWLSEKHVRPDEPLAYLRAVTLGPHLARLPKGLHEPFVSAVAEAMGEPLELDYVRLNIDARKPR